MGTESVRRKGQAMITTIEALTKELAEVEAKVLAKVEETLRGR